MRNWKPDAPRLLLLLLAGLVGACGTPAPPEQRVRDFVVNAEQLTEDRQFTELVALIASDYLDEHGNDKLKAAALLRGFYLRNKSVHLLTRIEDIRLPSPERAVATIYVAMAKRPFEDTAAWPDADLFRVEIELAEDGDNYEILQTRWQRASAADAVF